jgi:hypothetical protein
VSCYHSAFLCQPKINRDNHNGEGGAQVGEDGTQEGEDGTQEGEDGTQEGEDGNHDGDTHSRVDHSIYHDLHFQCLGGKMERKLATLAYSVQLNFVE